MAPGQKQPAWVFSLALACCLLRGPALAARFVNTILSPGISYNNLSYESAGAHVEVDIRAVELEVWRLCFRPEKFPNLGFFAGFKGRQSGAKYNSKTEVRSGNTVNFEIKSSSLGFTSISEITGLSLFLPLGDKGHELCLSMGAEFQSLARVDSETFTVDPVRAMVSLGLNRAPNATGYFVGGQLFATRAGYHGDVGSLMVRDATLIGFSFHWIGLQWGKSKAVKGESS